MERKSKIVQKFIEYTPVTANGQTSNNVHELKLNVLEESGNYLLHKNLLRHYALQKQGTVSTKTRSEVRGGGSKPWRQKGTGRARAGSNRSPLWKGGGVIFGPRSCNIYKSKINKKEKKLAIKNILYNKAHATSIIANNFHDLVKPNTKVLLDQLKSMGVIINTNTRTLLVVDKKYTNLYLSIRNIYYIDIIQADQLNALELLKAHQIIITTDGFKLIKQIYHDYN